MPHSPATRILAALIVVGFFVFLLWPSVEAHQWGARALFGLPILLLIFSWNAISGAAPFDDRAFHRTLPPGDGSVFGRVVALHLWVLAGISAAVTTYCWMVNFGWREITYGIAALVLPIWGFMAAAAIAMSAATSRVHWRSWAYISVFGVTLFSFGTFLRTKDKLPTEPSHLFYLDGLRTATLLAALVFPLVWWLVAARRRRRTGLWLGAATGALIPWLAGLGDFFPAEPGERSPFLVSEVRVYRQAIQPGDEPWLAVDEVLAVEELEEGEIVWISGFYIRDLAATDDRRLRAMGAYERPVHAVRGNPELPSTWIFAVGQADGGVEWGERAVWDHLRRKIPEHREFVHRSPELNSRTRLSFLRPGRSVETGSPDRHGVRRRIENPFSESEMTGSPWSMFSRSKRLLKLGELSARSEATFRLPTDGIIKIGPWTTEDGRFAVRFQHWAPDEKIQDRWFGGPRWSDSLSGLWMIGLLPDGTAWAIPGFELKTHARSQPVTVGSLDTAYLEAADPALTNLPRWKHHLEEMRLFLFWPTDVAELPTEIPPP